jgi:cell volume regulation protein A
MDLNILLLGVIILIGFIGNILFKYTKIPESLFMILIGLAVGPVFKLVDQSAFITYMPLVSTITMIIILLDSGFSLTIEGAVHNLSKAIRLTILVLLFSMVFISTFMYFGMGWDIYQSLFIGAISSGTTTVVIVHLLTRFDVPEIVKDTLILESIFNDVTLITMSVILLQIIKIQTFDMGQIVVSFVGPIVIALVFGLTFSLMWVGILWRLYRGEELIYVFTLGILFLLFFLVEAMGGIGALAILIFSLALGNLPLIINTIQDELILRKRVLSEFQIETFQFLSQRFTNITREIKHTEIHFSFIIKNFFFVYLGIIFDLENLNPIAFVISTAIIILMLLSRYVSVRISALFDAELKQHTPLMTIMIARGFTATFVALMPASEGIEIPHLKEVTLILVLVTTLITMTGTILFENRFKTIEDKPTEED